jgi:hypothetical protein
MTDQPKKRGRPPMPRDELSTALKRHTLHTRPAAPADLDAMCRWLFWVDVVLKPYGGRQRLAVLTGYSRRSVDTWFYLRTPPLGVVVTLSMVAYLRSVGFQPQAMAPHLLTWPTGFELIPYLPGGDASLLEENFRQWLETNAPVQYAARYSSADTSIRAYVPPASVDKLTAYLAQQRLADLLAQGRLHEMSVADYYAANFYPHTLTHEEATESIDKKPPGRPRTAGTAASGTGTQYPTGGYESIVEYTDAQEQIELAAIDARRKAAQEDAPQGEVHNVGELVDQRPLRGPALCDSLEEMAKAWGA